MIPLRSARGRGQNHGCEKRYRFVQIESGDKFMDVRKIPLRSARGWGKSCKRLLDCMSLRGIESCREMETDRERDRASTIQTVDY